MTFPVSASDLSENISRNLTLYQVDIINIPKTEGLTNLARSCLFISLINSAVIDAAIFHLMRQLKYQETYTHEHRWFPNFFSMKLR